MLTLGVGLEASYGARSALLMGSPRQRHLLDPQVGRASAGAQASERTARRYSVGQHAPRVPARTESNEPQLSTPREGGLAWVSPRAKHGQAGSRLQVRAPFDARVLNHEKEPT
jgi:hypothetical protein